MKISEEKVPRPTTTIILAVLTLIIVVGVKATLCTSGSEALEWYSLAHSSQEAEGFRTPEWVKHAIFYQIFVDRFRDDDPTNNPWTGDEHWEWLDQYIENRGWGDPRVADGRVWFGGDLRGVQEKIPYLVDMGITAIYFNPIHDSTDSHGYTVIDYKSINRYFGIHGRGPNGELILVLDESLQVFKELMATLNEENIKVVLDAVWNHCSAKHPWFDRDNDYPTLGAYESKESSWYHWFDFYVWPDDYGGWWGIPQMPEIVETDEFKDYIYRDPENSVIKFWDELGVDGWRLDCGGDVSHDFWREFRTYYKQLNPRGYIVGEWWGDASPWLQGDQWDATMNYRFRDATLDWANGGSVNSFDASLKSIQRDYPPEAFYASFNLLSSHDPERVLWMLKNRKERMKLAVIFQMTYPGVPVIYYGDEIGMTGSRDPYNRNPYPWPDTNKTTLTLMAGIEYPFEPDLDMFEHHKKLVEIRKSYSVLRTGALATKLVDDANHIYVLFRRDNSENPFAAMAYNNGDVRREVTIDVGEYLMDGEVLTDVLNEKDYVVGGGEVTVSVDGMWASILISGIKPKVVTKPQPVFIVGIMVVFSVLVLLWWKLRQRRK